MAAPKSLHWLNGYNAASAARANNPERIAYALRLRTDQKMGIASIAKMVKASPNTIRRWLVERNMPIIDPNVTHGGSRPHSGPPPTPGSASSLKRERHRERAHNAKRHPNSELGMMSANTMPAMDKATESAIRNAGKCEDNQKELNVTKADIWTCVCCSRVIAADSLYCRECQPKGRSRQTWMGSQSV